MLHGGICLCHHDCLVLSGKTDFGWGHGPDRAVDPLIRDRCGKDPRCLSDPIWVCRVFGVCQQPDGGLGIVGYLERPYGVPQYICSAAFAEKHTISGSIRGVYLAGMNFQKCLGYGNGRQQNADTMKTVSALFCFIKG